MNRLKRCLFLACLGCLCYLVDGLWQWMQKTLFNQRLSGQTVRRSLRRRRPRLEDEGAWLTTYSDAVTLLLAFFIMILSVAEIDQGKVEELKEGLAESLSKRTAKTPFKEIAKNLEDLITEYDLAGNARVKMDLKGVQLEFSNLALYKSGSADIRPEVLPMLQKVSATILASSQNTHTIEVEGHTDDLPIRTEQFPSNWELSASRATNVVKYFIAQGIDKSVMKASGYADSRPKVTLDPEAEEPLEAQRSHNRRVLIYIHR